MGRINLTPLRLKKRALANIETKRTTIRPNWLEVVSEIPPAQVLTRQQPIQHLLTETRSHSLPNGKITQSVRLIESRKPKSSKSSKLFAPIQIRYEEDALRKRFFNDHPWELARPRVVLETSGDQHKHTDWSKGLIQPGMPLSGESVVQRQLWLLNNIPDITVPQSYDIARKEFYTLRRQEETRRRIAAEEAEAMGAQFGKSAIEWGVEVEDKMYDDWEKWGRQVVMEQDQRNAAFSGNQAPGEQQVLQETAQVENGRPSGRMQGGLAGTVGTDVFAAESERQFQTQRSRAVPARSTA